MNSEARWSQPLLAGPQLMATRQMYTPDELMSEINAACAPPWPYVETDLKIRQIDEMRQVWTTSAHMPGVRGHFMVKVACLRYVFFGNSCQEGSSQTRVAAEALHKMREADANVKMAFRQMLDAYVFVMQVHNVHGNNRPADDKLVRAQQKALQKNTRDLVEI